MFLCFALGNTRARSIYIEFARSVDIDELVLLFLSTKRQKF